MRKRSLARVLLLVPLVVTLTTLTARLQEKGGENEFGPYAPVEGWPKWIGVAGYAWGSHGGIFAETPNKIFIAQRGMLPVNAKGVREYGADGRPATSGKPMLQNNIIVVDGQGNLLQAWKQHDHLFQKGRGPHKIKISPYDPQKHVWVVDDNSHQIFKFTNDGSKLVMTLGEQGVAGNDDKHFGRPTDIAWLPDGTFFISDGYANTRVVKFDRNGRYLMTWGTPGTGPGQFNLPHAIDIDAKRRVYVSDRSNSRIQVFDENGKHLDTWPNMRSPYHIMVSQDQHLWVADGISNKVLKYDLNGKLLYGWGTYGTYPGSFWGIHQFHVDDAGNFYIAETFGGRAQKFQPRPGANPAELVGRPMKPAGATSAD
jgi:DNA-binding beta-propeller fold protein YncE